MTRNPSLISQRDLWEVSQITASFAFGGKSVKVEKVHFKQCKKCNLVNFRPSAEVFTHLNLPVVYFWCSKLKTDDVWKFLQHMQLIQVNLGVQLACVSHKSVWVWKCRGNFLTQSCFSLCQVLIEQKCNVLINVFLLLWHCCTER